MKPKMIRFDDILEKMTALGHLTEKDIFLFKKAYVFAAAAHKGQVRRSGEPYLSHPLEVTNMLADMGLDKTTLIAGLLHDVLEDTDVTLEELQENFGSEIARLVEGVTKITRVEQASPETQQAETIRKIILAMTDDLRTIFIKLADRLHNLQTLRFLPEAKQRQIAKETLEIYAPIANRLGMGRIKAELEDLAFRYVAPQEYFRMAAIVEPLRQQAEPLLLKFKERLEKLLQENNIPCEIQTRIKRLYSIYKKMKRREIDFDEVYDFLALRIITDSIRNCYAALGIIHQKWPPIPNRFRDFIAVPKPNLYQSLHTTVITEDKLTVEIQIRTREMHALAENGIAAHWRYKEGPQAELIKEDKRLEWLREMVEMFQEQKNPLEFLKVLKTNLVPEEIYVFTPKGKVIALPAGASALDFAFKIHTEIGLHAAAAFINTQPVSLKTILKSGDIVEIITSPDKQPKRQWLRWVVTSTARHHIKRWLKQKEKARSIELGRRLWERALRRFHLPLDFKEGSNGLISRLANASGLNFKNLEDFFAALGYGRLVINERFLERLGLSSLAKEGSKEKISASTESSQITNLLEAAREEKLEDEKDKTQPEARFISSEQKQDKASPSPTDRVQPTKTSLPGSFLVKMMEKVKGMTSRQPRIQSTVLVKIEGLESDSALITLGRCCQPIKGEPIIGYITQGKGITVHALRCPLVAKEILASERMVEASWDPTSQGSFRASLRILSLDSPGVLAKVASAIAELNGNITRADIKTFAEGQARIDLGLTIRDLAQLETIIKKLTNLKEVNSVERL
ncbi:MAG: bifunctional (p)ppGpp synthetase/guanosine-3',5'-bis(diphosphate) 3'-pyrophosphohydrolase [Candidatus Aminicenantes bacterium]|nr:bifunctional (p)ppGpp synthetase/guanosine-3',5'-bis(diphosphate) 3'-pyrophosphohydrolase [Candidatus Aminicenantes bacterium]